MKNIVMKNTFLLLIGLMTLILSCTTPTRYIPFEKNLVVELTIAKMDFKNLDIYLSKTIQLYNGVQENSMSIEDGELVRNTKQSGQKVIILSSRRGKIVVQPNEDEIGVSFDKDDPSKFLMFGLDKKTGNYILLAKKWNENDGDITYGETVYKTSALNGKVKLLIKEKKNNIIEVKKEIASGRK